MLFDFGFKLHSNEETKLKWYSKICHCPLSRLSKKWKLLYELHWLDFHPHECDCTDKMTPNQLMDHLNSKLDTCFYHKVVLEYMNCYYSTFWETIAKLPSESKSHYAICAYDSAEYHDAMLTWGFYGHS